MAQPQCAALKHRLTTVIPCVWRVSWLLLFMAFSFCHPATAQSASLKLAFKSSTECAKETNFNRELDALLKGWQGESNSQFKVSVTGTSPVRITLAVLDNGETFQRQVVIEDCDLTPKVAALLVALTLDPATLANMSDVTALEALNAGDPPASAADASQSDTPPQTPPDGSRTSEKTDQQVMSDMPASAPADTPADTPADASTRSPFDHSVSLWVDSSWLALPKPGIGPAAEYCLQYRLFAFTVDSRFNFSPKSSITRGQATASFRIWLFSLHTGAGVQFSIGRWRFLPRLGLGFHWLLAKTSEFPTDSRDVQPVFAPWFGGVVRLLLNDAIGFMAIFNGDWLTADSKYRLSRGSTIHTTGNFLFQTGLGIFHFF